MTLITVVCYDFVILIVQSRALLKNRPFYRAVVFRKIRREKINMIFLFRPFNVRLKLHDVKTIYPIFAGTNVLSSAKTRLPRILTETL